MEKHIENIIKEKRFIELSSDEKRMVEEWARDEESFNNLQFLLRQVPTYSDTTHRSTKNKQKLDKLFYEFHGGTPSQRLLRTFFPPLNLSWNWFSPTLVGALGSVLIGSVLFFWLTKNENDLQKPQTKTAQKQEIKKKEKETNSPSETEPKIHNNGITEPILVASNTRTETRKIDSREDEEIFPMIESLTMGDFNASEEPFNDFPSKAMKAQVSEQTFQLIPSMDGNEELFNLLSASY